MRNPHEKRELWGLKGIRRERDGRREDRPRGNSRPTTDIALDRGGNPNADPSRWTLRTGWSIGCHVSEHPSCPSDSPAPHHSCGSCLVCESHWTRGSRPSRPSRWTCGSCHSGLSCRTNESRRTCAPCCHPTRLSGDSSRSGLPGRSSGSGRPRGSTSHDSSPSGWTQDSKIARSSEGTCGPCRSQKPSGSSHSPWTRRPCHRIRSPDRTLHSLVSGHANGSCRSSLTSGTRGSSRTRPPIDSRGSSPSRRSSWSRDSG